MDAAMAPPPPKRRRLHGSPSSEKDGTKHLKAASTRAYEPGALGNDASPPMDNFEVLVPRQDAGAVLSAAEGAVGGVVSGVVGAVTAAPAISASLSVGLDPSIPLVTSIIDGVTSIVGGVNSAVNGVTSILDLDPSSATPSSSGPSGTDTPSTPSGTSTDATPLTSSDPASKTSSTSSTISTGVPSSTSNTTTSLPATSSSGLPALSSSTSQNSTTTITTTSNGRTTSSRSSITPAPESSRRPQRTFLESSAVVATFSDGDVSSFMRSSEAYVTTVEGEIYTVPAIQILTSYAYVPGGAGTPTAATPSATASLAGGGSSGSSSPPAGTIAGGVVGGAAGLAVVVLIAMLAMRWYRRKGSMAHRALPAGSGQQLDGDGADEGDKARGPGMAERAGMMPFAAAGLLRHRSQSANESSEPSERGFTRVSGRKLPSAYSGGMSRPPPPSMPLTEESETDRNGSSASWYQDNSGYYGVDGESPPADMAPIRTSSHDMMTMSPGPQRTPKIHSGGPYTMSPAESAGPSSPAQPYMPGLVVRNGTPSSLLDPNRESRFTEEM